MNNTIMLVGNVTGEVKLVKTPDGSEVANFSVAVTRYYDKAKKEQVTDFFDCVAWKELAKNIAASIKKGTRVILSGKIITDTWEDDEGKKKTKAKAFASSKTKFLGAKRKLLSTSKKRKKTKKKK